MSAEFSFTSRYPTIYARLHGKNGAVREYRALINTTTDYCFLPRVDAYRLGYPEAAHDDPVTIPANLVMLATSVGYSEGMMIMMRQVEIGDLKIEDVPFLGFDLPQVIGFDVVLGRNLFQKGGLSLGFDYSLDRIRIAQKSAAGK
ncbi:MAG: hypothetical protein ACREBS_10025 [Nitrososphaerales archaeon]